jgi:hypothetical protein
VFYHLGIPESPLSKIGIPPDLLHDIRPANRLRYDEKNKPGMSFWVGEVSDIARKSFRDVETLQQGLIGLAQHAYVNGSIRT